MTILTINTASVWTIEKEGERFSLYSFTTLIGTYDNYGVALEVLFTTLERADVPMEFNVIERYHGR